MTTENAPSFSHVCTITDLTAVCAAHSAEPADLASRAIPAETSAARALRAAAAVIGYAATNGPDTEEPESTLADLVADLHHLADHLGLDWNTITRRVTNYHFGESTGGVEELPAPDQHLIPELEIIAVRDPDGGTTIEAYLGGAPIAATDYVIDAGAGWDWENWKNARDTNLAAASPTARAALLGHYNDPPGGQYVENRDDEPWIETLDENAA